MAALTWIVAGLVAGWSTGYALKGRGYGVVGNLLVGSAGGIIGGWVFQHVLHVTAEASGPFHVLVALFGGVLLVVAVRVLDDATKRARQFGFGVAEGGGSDLEAQVRRLGEVERSVLSHLLKRKSVVRDLQSDFEAQTTFGDRVADRVASFGGSWTFIGLFFAMMALWMLVNSREPRPFDPFPFILLNLLLSCLAAIQAPVIMMSQNRQASKDRLDAQNDYRVNLNAEMQVLALHTKLDQLREEQWGELVELQRQQIGLLSRILGERA